MARSAALLLCALALAGCQTLAARVERGLWRDAPIDMERRVDLLPPTGLRVSSTASRQVALAWDPVLVGAVSGYAILRAGTEGSFAPIGRTASRFDTVYVDAGRGPERLGDGASYRYRVYTLDLDGSLSRDHAEVAATTDPPPEPPTGLRAFSNLPRRVVLAWDPNSGSDVAGYAVLRSPTLAGPWDRVAELEGRLSTVHEDPVPGDLRVLYYSVLAMNEFGGESETSDPIRAVTKAEPLPPIGLEVTGRALGRVVLAWKPNVEPDLRGYRIYRAEHGERGWGGESEIASLTQESLAFTDAQVGCGQRLRYRMRAVDADGLESDYSKPLDAMAEDLEVRARRLPEGWRIEWDPKRAEGWPQARVSQVRWALPDRALGEAPAQGPFETAGLPRGEIRLGVTLVRPPTAPGEPLEAAPRCDLVLRVPE